jgi:Tol biopolymer transport system component/DNA-binding winged helix-turn-helix (wHTH) protein
LKSLGLVLVENRRGSSLFREEGVGFRQRKLPIHQVTQPREIVRFGAFDVNLGSGELRKHGVRIKLHEQPFQVLAMLVARPGEVVMREEIREKLWPTGTFVDFDNGLNSAVNRLRDALGDSASEPKFIETVPRRGYRLLVSVHREPSRNEQVATENGRTKSDQENNLPAKGKVWSLRLTMTVGVVVAMGLISAGVWRRAASTPAARGAIGERLSPVPLVTYAGGEQWLPAFSPDGSRVAYSWSTAGAWFLEVKLLGSETRSRLTKKEARFPPGPTWSPDGSQIAYVRANVMDDRGIFIISAMGGSERKLRSLSPWRVPQRVVHWSPDGRWIVFADETANSLERNSKERGPNVLYLISPETLETRQLTVPVGHDFGDAAAAFSPDGKTIAFVHTTAESHDEICTIPVTGGSPRTIVTKGLWTNGLTWTADGKSIVFDRSFQGGFSLWQVSVSSGEMRHLDLPSDGINLLEPTVLQDRLAYEAHHAMDTIGRVRLGSRQMENPQMPLASTRNERVGRYSPRGERVAFISDRTGADQLWMADSNGADAVQLTNLGVPLNDVAWSPDGEFVAVSTVSGKVFLVSVETRNLRLVFEGPAFIDERAPEVAFSRDGKSLYVPSEPGTGEKYVLLRVPVDGGAPVRVLEQRITNFAESPDGRSLFYSRVDSVTGRDRLSIWKRPVEGGPERFVTGAPGMWDIVARGLYLVTESGTLDRYSLDGKRLETVARIAPEGFRPPLSVAPDGKSALLGYSKNLSIEIDSVRGVK